METMVRNFALHASAELASFAGWCRVDGKGLEESRQDIRTRFKEGE